MAAKKKTEPVAETAPEVTPTVENEVFYDEIVIPQELVEQVQEEGATDTFYNPIVKIAQKTPSGMIVIRQDGTRQRMTKAEYRAEMG